MDYFDFIGWLKKYWRKLIAAALVIALFGFLFYMVFTLLWEPATAKDPHPAQSSASEPQLSATSDSAESSSANAAQKTAFLPEAQNDTLFAVVGGDADAQARSVDAKFTEESYPVGTQSATLALVNRSENTLHYASYFDYRRQDGDQWLPLTPAEGRMENPDALSAEEALAPGGTAYLSIPLDLFDPPLTAGTYRVAQLATLVSEDGSPATCTEITAEFVIQ